MKIIVEKDTLVEKIGQALDEMIKSRGNKPLLLLLSGGSSLELLNYVQEDSLSADITIGMLDDRYSYDSSVNSYSLLQSPGFASDFYKKARKAGVRFLDSTPFQFETLNEYASRYEKTIEEWMIKNPEGIIRATVGIGPDGHTSGVLPYPEDPEKFNTLFNGEKLIIGYDVENKNPFRYRLTSTFTFMRQFNEVLTYMSGENKMEALKKVIAEEGSLAETPGRIVRELKNVTIYTDIEL
ncbi:6-phosphogluconolactonase [Candidatus Parcubacteria bacterium]|nr:6-phosphogluconolactonase [Candidatus Parcubacteria bacterium]